MIQFTRKKVTKLDLMPKMKDYLEHEGLEFEIISDKDSKKVSGTNSKSVVLKSFMRTEDGYFQIKLQDKELYSYTQKQMTNIFHLRIVDINEEDHIVTAETDYEGRALHYIESLALNPKYSLYLVESK